MDCLSAWIQNKQYLSQMSDNALNELKDEIINDVFGGFNNLLNSLLKNYHDQCMTHSQQLKLNHILSNHQSNSIDINVSNNKSSLFIIPDDCIYNTMKFMDYNTRLTLQFCCRTLSIIARKPLHFHTKTDLISIGAFKHNIATLILSDDISDNLAAINHIVDNIILTFDSSKYVSFSPAFNKLMTCNINIPNKLAKILNENISNNICQTCVVRLMYYNEFIDKIYPSIIYMVQSLEINESDRNEMLQHIVDERLKEICFVFNVMQQKNCVLIKSIINSVVSPSTNYYIQSKDGSSEQIIKKILSLGFTGHIKHILDNGTKESNLYFLNDIIKTITKESEQEVMEYIINNAALMNLLSDKLKNIKVGDTLTATDRGTDYLATINEIDERDGLIQIHYDGYDMGWSEWFDLEKEEHCIRLKWYNHSYLKEIIDLFQHSTHNQRVKMIKKGYFKEMDHCTRCLIVAPLNDEAFAMMLENYIKRWKIMIMFLENTVPPHIINQFEQCINGNEYDFKQIFDDINRYNCNQSVIMSTMQTVLKWNGQICYSFYVILKLILIVEVLDFDDEYIEKSVRNIIIKYQYNSNNSKFPSIPSTKFFNIINKSTYKHKQTSYSKNADKKVLCYYIGKPLSSVNHRYNKQLKRSRNAHHKSKITRMNCRKNSKIRYKYHRKRP